LARLRGPGVETMGSRIVVDDAARAQDHADEVVFHL
jgi:hypothetical protein